MYSQFKRWCATDNNRTADWEDFKQHCDALIVAKEIGEEKGTEHYQCAFILKKKQSIAWMKSQLTNTVHFEKMKGSAAQAAQYCRKDGDFWEFGTWPGKRKLSQFLRDGVKQGKSALELVDEEPSAMMHLRAISDLQFLHQTKKAREWRQLSVTVLWGDTGVGKTRKAREDMPDAFFTHLSAPEWWDGYNGETELVIDDYDSGVPCVRLLNLLDGHPCRLPVKGGFRWALWTKVIVTSNYPPENWHAKAKPEHHAALMRRITRNVQLLEREHSDKEEE